MYSGNRQINIEEENDAASTVVRIADETQAPCITDPPATPTPRPVCDPDGAPTIEQSCAIEEHFQRLCSLTVLL